MCAGTNNSLWTERDSGQAVEHWTEECVTHNNKITSGYVLRNCFFFLELSQGKCALEFRLKQGRGTSDRRGGGLLGDTLQSAHRNKTPCTVLHSRVATGFADYDKP